MSNDAALLQESYRVALDGNCGDLVRVGSVVVGCTHKLIGHATALRAYIGDSLAVTAGDQDRGFCSRLGLASVDTASHFTWPATCSSAGTERGDNICSNMRVLTPEWTRLPCIGRYQRPLALSDHALTHVILEAAP